MKMNRRMLSIALFWIALALSRGQAGAQAQPDGQLTIAFDVSIASTILEPAETRGLSR